jgi:hypothetical protein
MDDPLYHIQGDSEKHLFLHPFGMDWETFRFRRISRPIGVVSEAFGHSVTTTLDWALANNEIDYLIDMYDRFSNGRLTKDMEEGKLPEFLKRLGRAKLFTHPKVQEILRNEMRSGDRNAFKKWWEELQDVSVGRFAQAPYPTALAPIVDLMRNFDSFFETNIVPRRFLDDNAALPQDIKVSSTTPIEEGFAWLLRKVPITGMDKINPIQARYLMTRYAGSLGNQYLRFVDKAMQSVGLFPERPSRLNEPSEVRKAFLSKPIWGSGSSPVSEFYELYKESSAAYNSLKDRARNLNIPGANFVLEEHPEWVMGKFMDSISGEMTEINSAYRAIQENEEMEPIERQDILMQLDQLKTMVALMAVQTYERYMENPDEFLRIALGES